uniref:Uncharacterized protein n=1 Tax=Gallus gallus TaxID=9031 RepID=A0A8V0Z2M9_CHICK
ADAALPGRPSPPARRLSPGAARPYLVVLPGARRGRAVTAHHIRVPGGASPHPSPQRPQEQGVAAQPAQPQSHRGTGRGVTPSRSRRLPSPWQRRRAARRAPRPARALTHTSGRNAAPRQRGPAGPLRRDTPGPGVHPRRPFLSPIAGRAGPPLSNHRAANGGVRTAPLPQRWRSLPEARAASLGRARA